MSEEEFLSQFVGKSVSYYRHGILLVENAKLTEISNTTEGYQLHFLWPNGRRREHIYNLGDVIVEYTPPDEESIAATAHTIPCAACRKLFLQSDCSFDEKRKVWLCKTHYQHSDLDDMLFSQQRTLHDNDQIDTNAASYRKDIMPVSEEVAVRHDALKYAFLIGDNCGYVSEDLYLELAKKIARFILVGEK